MNANYVFVYDMVRLNKLKEEITEILFEKGHNISKPMIDDIATWAYGKEDRVNLEARTQTTSAESGPVFINVNPPKDSK
jgi:hypothetical protein